MDVGEVKGKITADSSGFSASTEAAKNDLKNMANEMIKAMRDVVREQTRAIQTIEQDKAKERQAVREAADAHRKAAEETQKAARAQADAQKKAADEAQQAARKQADAAREQENALKRLAVTSGVALAGIMKTLKEAVSTTVEFRNAMMGLESVAKGTGQDLDRTKKAAQALSADGLMPLADAATGLKNLLATGFSLDEGIVLMERFKDSAAFGRQGSLEFGEAIRTATEGIKNGNSILVDNAGVTKNLSVMLQEAGISANKLMHAADDVNVRMAIYNGIVRETANQTGDAKKLADSFGGSLAKTSTSVDYLKNALGEAVAGPLTELLEIIQPIINGLTEWIEENKTLAGTIVVVTTALTGLVALATSAKLLGGLAALKTSIAALGAAFTFLFTTPVGLAITAIVTLTAAIIKYRSDQKKATEEVQKAADEAREAATANEKQAESLESLHKKYLDIETRLQAAKKGTDEYKRLQRELNETTQKIANIAPHVVTAYNNMGEARQININLLEQEIQKTRELARAQEEKVGEKLQNAYVEAMLKRDRTARQLEEAIKEGERIRKAGITFGPNDPKYRDWEKEVANFRKELQQDNKELEEARERYLNYMVPRRPTGDRVETTTAPTPGGGDKTKKNEALEKAWADFEKERARLAKEMKGKTGDELTKLVFASYQKQADYLKNNVLIHAKTQAEKDKIESQIFNLMMQRYERAAEKDDWTTQQKLDNLDDYLKGYTYSIDHYNQIDTTRRTLQAQLADEEARAKDEAYANAMENYNKETAALDLSIQERKDLYTELVVNKLSEAERSAEAIKAIELQQLIFQRELDAEELAEQRANSLKQLEIQALHYELLGRERDAELKREEIWYLKETQGKTLSTQQKMDIDAEYEARTRAINQKHDSAKLKHEQELAEKLAETRRNARDKEFAEVEAYWQQEYDKAQKTGADLIALGEWRVSEMLRINKKYEGIAIADKLEHEATMAKISGDSIEAEIKRELAAWALLATSGEHTEAELIELMKLHDAKIKQLQLDHDAWLEDQQFQANIALFNAKGEFMNAELEQERQRFAELKRSRQWTHEELETLEEEHQQKMDDIRAKYDDVKTLSDDVSKGLEGSFVSAIDSITDTLESGLDHWRALLRGFGSIITSALKPAFSSLTAEMGKMIASASQQLTSWIAIATKAVSAFLAQAYAALVGFFWFLGPAAPLAAGAVIAAALVEIGKLGIRVAQSMGLTKPDIPDDSGGKKKSGTQISEITGPTRDILISLLSPLKSLDILPGLFDSMRTAIYEMRDAMLGYNFDLAPAGAGGALGDTFRIDTLVIETSVTNATDLDALMRTMGDKARVVVKGSGG